MSKANLIIGVGGTGKGVIEWLKKKISLESSGVENTSFLCIDSTAEDSVFQLPDGHLIDFGNDKEFYHLKEDPKPVLRTVRGGGTHPFISQWLSKEDAENLPEKTCDPTGGLGQNRVCGRMVMFLEADGISNAINTSVTEMLKKLKQGNVTNQFINIVLIGSEAGGTGSGTFLDIAQLIRNNIGHGNVNIKFIGIVVLPTNFDSVMTRMDTRKFRDARSFAFTRELVRLGYSKPVYIEYSDAVKVKNDYSFDLCMLIGGKNRKVVLGSDAPMYGVCPAIGDFVYALIKDPGDAIRNDLKNALTKMEGNEPSSKFSSVGVSEYIYPEEDVLDTFSFKFIGDLFAKLINSNSSNNNGQSKAEVFLKNALPFTKLVLDYKTGRILPINSPLESREHVISLKNAFLSGEVQNNQYFPEGEPFKNLTESVDYTLHFFHKISNQDVISQTKKQIENYIGSKTSTDVNTVWGWVNYQTKLIEQKFLQDLVSEVKDIFVEPSTGNYKTLKAQPNLLAVAYNLLDSTNKWLDNFKDFIDNKLKDYSDPDKNPVNLQENEIQNIEKRMMEEPSSRYIQEQYIDQSQLFLECQIWSIFLNQVKQLSIDLSSISGHIWNLFGSPTEGWKTKIEEYSAEMEKKYNSKISNRQKMDVPSRTYFPSPRSAAELQLYQDLVIKKNYLDSMLEQMSWEFVVPDDESLYGQYQLLLALPKGFNLQKVENNQYKVVFTDEKVKYRVGVGNIENYINFGKNILKGELNNLDVWDLLRYEYEKIWKPNNKGKELDDFVSEKIDYLRKSSEPFLHLIQNVPAKTFMKTHIIGRFLSNPNPSNNREEIANGFYTKISREEMVEANKNDSDYKNRITALSLEHIIPIYNWSQYNEGEQAFFGWIKSSTLPISIFPEEENASSIELEREEFGRSLKCLHPEIVSFLSDVESLKYLIISLFLGFIPKKKAEDPSKPSIYYVNGHTEGGGIATQINLGPSNDILSVIQNYTNHDNYRLRKAVKELYLEEARKLSDKDAFISELKDLPEAIDKKNFGLDKEREQDLKDVFKVIINETIKKSGVNRNF